MSKNRTPTKQSSKKTTAKKGSPSLPSKRQRLSKETRDKATLHQTATGSSANQPRYDVPFGLTPDEQNQGFKNYAASFNKLLEHDTMTGLLTDTGPTNGRDSYQHLLNGLKVSTPNSDFDQAELNKINLAKTMEDPPRVLINPQSSKALTIKGGDLAAYSFKKSPIVHQEWETGYKVVYAQGRADTDDLLEELSFNSGYSAAEMVEVYGMALLRDLDFGVYTIPNPDVQLVLDALNAFGNHFRGPKEKQPDASYKVTAKTLFRGNSPESLRGDYLSKFLLLRRPPLFASGCAPGTANIINSQIFFSELAESMTAPQPNPRREFGLTWDDYVAIQNGKIPQKYQPGDFNGRVLISNGRNLAGLVHVDSLYQEHAWAVDVLTGGNYARTPVSPYSKLPTGSSAIYAKNEGDGPTLGPPDAAGLVGSVALEAARAAWGQKYTVARRARPEVFGALVHRRREDGNNQNSGPIDERLATDTHVLALLERIRQENMGRGGAQGATYLLSQVFPEASPAHPAWTSGHATVAGACVTVIKAIFDDTAPLLQQIDVKPPLPFKDENGKALTVGGELDKLASNIALGRNFGGVHFRSDGEHGILLGEEVAIRFLQDHLRTYRERFRCDSSSQGTLPCFELSRRNGERIKITAETVSHVPQLHAGAAKGKPTAAITEHQSIL